jgi:hypothetical protein
MLKNRNGTAPDGRPKKNGRASSGQNIAEEFGVELVAGEEVGTRR